MLDAFQLTIASWGALALLLLIQILVADFFGLKARHVPGSPVAADHSDPLFRASRTVANTNEGIAVYIIVILFCVFSGANATYTGYLSWAYVFARAGYAVCYYCNIQLLRSVMFGVALLMLIGLLLTGMFT